MPAPHPAPVLPEAHAKATQDRHWQRGLQGLALSLLLAVPGAWLARDIGLGLPAKACGPTAMLSLLLLAPMLEEYLLRSGLHAWLLQRWPQRLGGLSLANALCAAVFAIGHALRQNSGMLATVLPALWLGWLWERSGQRLLWPVLSHALFNAALLVWSCQA
jgi:uncharacterized protein